MAFEEDFRLLTGHCAYPWQRALHERFAVGSFPRACDLPTGLGKASVIVIWLLALCVNPRLPRRLVYVVNRRTVVDQATAVAEKLRARLLLPEARHLRMSLDAMSAAAAAAPVAISTLRGEFADNGEWRRDPSRPSIIVGTVDMIGSRLLFSGYGCGFRSRPLHAGFLGQDALLIHDEAHLEPAFQSLLVAIAEEQRRSSDLRPLQVLALSATSRGPADFTLGGADLADPDVWQRLHAKKRLQIHLVAKRHELAERVADKAVQLQGKVLVFLSSVEQAEKCAQLLRKDKHSVVTLTGTMRGAERDGLVRNPVFARFAPNLCEDTIAAGGTVFLVATSAGEVGIDLSADHLVTDLPTFDAFAQRLGRVNRYGEGDAEIHVFCEALEEPAGSAADGEEVDDDDEDKSTKRRDEYEVARFHCKALLELLPVLPDGSRDASPAALRTLPGEARAIASAPLPEIHHVDALLFDRWSCTTINDKLPGRPPVVDWLHGRKAWEPPRTTVAWRREVAWLTREHLGEDTLDDFLADYPLRSRETLSDVTARVCKQLEKLLKRDKAETLLVWLIRHDRAAEIVKLAELLDRHDPKKNPLLDNATVVLAPQAGGLQDGLLVGEADFDADQRYDLGPKDDERVVHEAEEAIGAPAGMRLVRSVKRVLSDGEDPLWWHLYAAVRGADDDGSRSSRRELLLDVHLQRTEAWALRIAECLSLSPPQREALARSGAGHDLGKSRRVWQRSIRRFQEPPLAKGPMQPSDLGHYRHELGSLHDVDVSDVPEDVADLALHLVAAHHGRARPHFPARESFDPELRDEVVAAIAREVPLRFDRLQRRYGRWGLAWLESILRAADVLGSEDEEVPQ